MLPINLPESNFTFTKPANMTDEECGDLRVWKGVDVYGFPLIISAWQPSKEDIEAINAGKPIYLMVTGQATPPVSVQTDYPWQVTENRVQQDF